MKIIKIYLSLAFTYCIESTNLKNQWRKLKKMNLRFKLQHMTYQSGAR